MQLLFGVCFTGGALFLSRFIAPRAGVVALTLFAISLIVVGFVLGRRPKWRRSLRGTRGGSGWIAEGSGGSGSSSSGSSSSGSSFGGGSSGGGGASGRW